MNRAVLPGHAAGAVLALSEGLSFWGGVDPATGRIIDAHHPQAGADLARRIVLMPTSRGSCSGSGVLLELALNGHAPAALVFREDEEILTLGALIAGLMFDAALPVARLSAADYAALAATAQATVTPDAISAGGLRLPLAPLDGSPALSPADRAMVEGEAGPAARLAMRVLIASAANQGAAALCDVTRVHIDGCIYASPANLRFARAMADLGARVRVPTTTNAISVDRANWRAQGVPPAWGEPAAALADAYVAMGAAPSFTCAPYLLDDPPRPGEAIGWAESNAVIYANSVLGARTVKHPDFLDLCIALTGRAPLAGVYLRRARRARRVLRVTRPAGADDAFWPLLGHLAGELSPDRIPLIAGLEGTAPTLDDLKALCAAFGTTSAAPMLHLAGITPEADLPPSPDADMVDVTPADLARSWRKLNDGPRAIDLVAIGSPHASVAECRALADALAGRRVAEGTALIVTAGRATLQALRTEGLTARLTGAGARVIPDLCWCSITEPVFPPSARTVMTSSGKYAHYGPGLSGRRLRFGSLADCVAAACTGHAPAGPPDWLT